MGDHPYKLGQIVTTPLGPLSVRQTSHYMCDDEVKYWAGFDRDVTWSSDHGFETSCERNRRDWKSQINELKPTRRALLEEGLKWSRPKADNDLSKDDVIDRLRTINDTVNAIKRAALKAGIIELDNCGRCGGSGSHSYCETYGTRCFGCGGSGRRAPSESKFLKAIRTHQRELAS